MGGGKSRTVQRIEYVQDPAILKQLQESRKQVSQLSMSVEKLQKDYLKALQEAKKLKDPNKYEEFKEKAFMAFVDNVYKLKFTDKIPRQSGQEHFVVVGNISVGKSSLLNYMFGLKLEVGLGQTTGEVSKVAQSQDGKTHIWDAPGVNQHFSLFDPENLSYFHCADRIFILYCDSPKVIKQIIILIQKIKPSNTFLVRTKCDSYDSDHKKTVREEIECDKMAIGKWGVKLPILASSNKKPLDYMDNNQLKRLLNGNK